MSDFKLKILGCGSATPSLRHLPSCQIVEHRGRSLMIDCGEGTQLSLRKGGIHMSQLTDIFLSHLHGDHCLGLPGLLSTLSLQQKGGAVTVHTFAEGARMLGEMMDFFCRERTFELRFNVIDPSKRQLLLDTDSLSVESFPLYHRIPCVGFIIAEKPKPRHLKGDMAAHFNVPTWQRAAIKAGADFVAEDGRFVPNSMLTSDADPSVSYAYCSDTMFDRRVAKEVEGVDWLYHEATYADDSTEKAHQRAHSTAREAAIIAREAHCRHLIIGHFSKSYRDETQHAKEAGEEFGSVVVANEGMTIDLINQL